MVMSNLTNSVNEKELLIQCIQDNKKISDELRIQLNTNESLQKEKIDLEVKFSKLLRDAELTKSRDEMIMKRNSSLVKEISDLKKSLDVANQGHFSLKNDYEIRLVSKDKELSKANEIIRNLERDMMHQDLLVAKMRKEYKALEGHLVKLKESKKKF